MNSDSEAVGRPGTQQVSVYISWTEMSKCSDKQVRVEEEIA
jgi:hypothetical protein